MKTTTFLFAMICVAFLASVVFAIIDPYFEIETEEVFSELIVRNRDDREYSGQIKSQEGLKVFSSKYSLGLKLKKVDFEKQMLIFGVTDNISTRAFRLLKQKKLRSFCLDYYDSGIVYKLVVLEEGRKYSYVQIFLIDRIEEISHIEVKNLIRDGLSKVYE